MSENSNNQKKELFKKIWDIAEKVRGHIDSWDFRNYVFAFLFYRYLSENINNYINDIEKITNLNFDYSNLSDECIDEKTREDIINEKGFFIYPSKLFHNVYKELLNNKKENVNELLSNIFSEIENSALGTLGEQNIKGIFGAVNFNAHFLGESFSKRNSLIWDVYEKIAELNLGSFENKKIDIFGDAYEYLMSMYASNAGKSGGEYFTPYEVSKLLTLLALNGRKKIHKIYDPTCGSGSLLLHVQKILGDENIKIGFFGQESNPSTYNLCRMNMFLHNINYDKFNIKCGDTLKEPLHSLDEKYDIIVSNPPYSMKWEGKNNPLFINDRRFSNVGILPPKSYADFAFILHCLYLLNENGKAAIVCFPGVLYRAGSEKKIRKYLIDNNYVDAIISLPDRLFFGTEIETCIMILSKTKNNDNFLFIDASDEYVKIVNQNQLSEENINKILNTYLERTNISNFSNIINFEKIQENDYDLSVNKYVKKKLVNQKINITDINKKIEVTSDKINSLRNEIDLIIEEIENEFKRKNTSYF